MNHEKFETLVHAYVDGFLGDSDSKELFSHLGSCHGCRGLFHSSLAIHTTAVSERYTTRQSLDERVLGKRESRSGSMPQIGPYHVPWSSMRLGIPLPAASSVAILLVVLGLLIAPILFRTPASRDARPEIQSFEEARTLYPGSFGINTWRDISQ